MMTTNMEVSVSKKLMLSGLMGSCEAVFAIEQLLSASQQPLSKAPIRRSGTVCHSSNMTRPVARLHRLFVAGNGIRRPTKVLQQLQLPSRFVSLPIFVSGFSSILLVSVLGWLSDLGYNAHTRKMAAVLFSTGVIVSGMSCMMMANILNTKQICFLQQHGNFVDNNTGIMKYPSSSNTTKMAVNSTTSRTTTTMDFLQSAATADQSDGQVSPCAWLAVAGFIGMDVGVATGISFCRSWALSCLPFAQHASLLKIGVILSSIGEAIPAALGSLDLDSLLGTKGSVVTILETICLTLVLSGTLTTIVTGRRQYEIMNKDNNTIDDRNDLKNESDSSEGKLSKQHVQSNGISDNDNHHFDDKTHPPWDTEDSDSSEDELMDRDYHTAETVPMLSAAKPLNSGTGHSSKNTSDDRITSRLQFYFQRLCPWPMTCPKRGFKWKMANIFLGTYFSTGAVLLFDFLAADFAGKAIYGGSPLAEEGSMEAERYQEGIRMSAWCLLAYSAAFLLYSFVQHCVLDLCGFRMEFVVSQLVVSCMFALLAMTSRLELLFLLASAAGMRRASQCLVPFKLANDAMHQQTQKTKCPSKVGTAMAIVTIALPFASGTLYSWVSLLEERTGSIATRMWLGSVYAALSAVFFLLLPAQ